MTLFMVLLNLDQFPKQHSLYVLHPWTLESETLVQSHTSINCITMGEDRYSYFLPISTIQQYFKYLEVKNVCLQDSCQRIIEFAQKNQ
ncbi:hypothetical protein E0H82_01310 [Acinetobacter sp. ANC 4910]|uniref:hypothetical protein n=1 Tax=Acinetobacter sp. ANC 4910 TaxID=2529850 RepID=UPI00103A2B21|nr:hypothetical protein [Acinetobacter sp. ANC 4910]TCB38262.1 hypothetical protein E0H82_01310 [Acinetobacter sp. ANC 4910]